MKKTKRMLAFLICLVMVVGMFPTGVFAAAEGGLSDIDFTKEADAGKYEIIGKTSAAQSEAGLALVTTRNAVETCNGQNSGTQATTPEDLVYIDVAGDWTATLEVDFNTNGAANGYYQFFGFYANMGENYQNMAGIRGGDGAMQNFLRVDGNITADSSDLNSTPGFSGNGTYWLRLVKEGDTYFCYRSADGVDFTQMFAYEGTGIEADSIVIDAYTGMTANYKFTLKYLELEGGESSLDKKAIRAAIREAKAKDSRFFTADSFAKLTAALEAANTALAEAETQEALDKAAADLNAAIAALVDNPDLPMMRVTFNYNYTGAPDPLVVEVQMGSTVQPPEVKRVGYTATWRRGNSNFNFNTPIDEDITLTANWSKDWNQMYSLAEEYADFFPFGNFGTQSPNGTQVTREYNTYSGNSGKMTYNFGANESRNAYNQAVSEINARTDITDAEKAELIKQADGKVMLGGNNPLANDLNRIQQWNQQNPDGPKKYYRQHVLFWHGSEQNAAFYHEGFDNSKPLASKEVMNLRIDSYVEAMFKRYQQWDDIILSWDVVNEALDDYTGMVRNGWNGSSWGESNRDDASSQSSAWGTIYRMKDENGNPVMDRSDERLLYESEWIRVAFESAQKWKKELGVHWTLYYNDYMNSSMLYEPKLTNTYKILQPIADAGNLDGYGMQARLAYAYPTIQMLRDQIEHGLTLGKEVSFSETDVRMDFEPNPQFDPDKPTRRVQSGDEEWDQGGSGSYNRRSQQNGNTYDVSNGPVRRKNNFSASDPQALRDQADFYADLMDIMLEKADQGKVGAIAVDGTSDSNTFNSNTGCQIWDSSGNEKPSFFAVIGAPNRFKMGKAIAAGPARSEKSKYTAASWARYEAALKAAEDLVDVRIYTGEGVEAVKDATVELLAATAALEESTEPVDPANMGLKDYFKDYFRIGTAVSVGEVNSEAGREFMLKHFNSVTCENDMKPQNTINQAACQAAGDNVTVAVQLNNNARTILKFCEDNGIPMRGHVFCWHSQTPAWLFNENFDSNGATVSKEIMDQRLESYIKNYFELLAREYPNLKFYSFDVVNEAFTDSNPAGMRGSNQSGWIRVYGDETFIYKAFEIAHKYKPEGCLLAYNDYNEYNDGKVDAIYNLAKDLYQKGWLDAVGMQGHLELPSNPTIERFRNALARFASIGCRVMVTELDVQNNNNDQQLSDYYQQLFETLIDYKDSIEAVVFWGNHDGVSWRSNRTPLLFRSGYEPKPAYYAVLDAISDHEHVFESKTVQPTCTQDGYVADVCTICDRTIVRETIPALGHDWDEGKVTLAPTEETPGVMTYTCKRCGETKTKRIPRTGSTAPDDIDFTNEADADKFEIVGQQSAAIAPGVGLALVTSQGGVEPAKQNIAETPIDVIEIPVEGDWTATLETDFDTNGAANGYYQFFGFYGATDYNNMVGIRGGDGAMQDFIRKEGAITEETRSNSPGFASAGTYYLRLEKVGDTYTCYRSSNGEDFTEMFSYADTGIEAEKIVIDAYTGMTTGYKFTLKSLTFEEGGEPQGPNKTALNKAISDAEKVDTSKYTDETVAALNAALADAKAAQSSTDQAVIDAAAAGLNAAIAALEKKPDVPVPSGDLKLGPNVVKDPDSPTGYTVKFLYDNDSVASVTFNGDISLKNDADRSDGATYTPFQYKPGLMRAAGFNAAMEKRTFVIDGEENEVWYYEVPMSAGANQYWYTLPGSNRMQPDPHNPPKWSPNSSANKDAYNIVYVPYDPKQDYEPTKAREAECPREDGKSGVWDYYPIEFGGRTHYMGIYTPYGYVPKGAKAAGGPYKLIFMLHGMGQDESDWMGIGSVQKIMDNLVAAGKTEPAVIVSVTSNNGFLGTNGSNVDQYVLPYLYENYNVSTDPMDQAWAGLSMGSSNTQSMINNNAPRFGWYGCFSLGNSVTATNPDLAKTHILFGDGTSDFGALNANQIAAVDTINANGGFAKFERVTGGHDFNTWCQLFRIWCEKYLWNPYAFGDGEAPVEELKLGPNVIKDPESPTGYTVKFLYKNDEATAVNFNGDISLRNDADRSDTRTYDPTEYRPGLMRGAGYSDKPMEKRTFTIDGVETEVWYYEVPLACGANQYWFTLPGNSAMIPDPANTPIWSPTAQQRNGYNYVYIPYDEKQDYEVLKAREVENPRADKKGTWSYVPIEIGGTTHHAGVYLPYGYDANRAEPYKTIWILHGGGQDESDWMNIGSVQNIMDNLAAEGRTEPAVIVSPTTNSNMLGSERDAYANLFNVVLPFIEEHYNVSKNKMDRAFGGLSMGSMNTQNIINANTTAEKFGYYGPWSGGVSVQANAPGIEYAHILFAGGSNDFGWSASAGQSVENLINQGVYADYMTVTGAHDFNTWCQMFRIWCEDYLWNPAAFGDGGETDTAALEAKITEAEAIDTAPYTDRTVANLVAAIEAAKGVVADPLNQRQIDKALADLENAIARLKEKPSGPVTPTVGDSIDFTNPADAGKYEISGQSESEVVEGEGLALVASQGGVEPAKQSIAEQDIDVVKVPVSGDWTATLEVEFDANGAANGYYQFFGFYGSQGGDNQNMVGIRGGDGAMQDFIRKDGAITEETQSSAPGFDTTGKTYFLRIEKEGDSYVCYRSDDGEDFAEMFSYAETGIEPDEIIIDAYTGMTAGYKFTLKSLTIESEGAPAGGYVLADKVEVGKTYVIVADGQYAMTNRQEGPALRTYAGGATTTLASAPVIIDGDKIVSEVTDDMLWTIEESTAPEAYDGQAQYFIKDAEGNYFRRGSGSSGQGAQFLVEPDLYSTIRYNAWSFYPYEDEKAFAMYANSERAYGTDYPFYAYGNETSFDSPGRAQRDEADPFAFTRNDDCAHIQLFEKVGDIGPVEPTKPDYSALEASIAAAEAVDTDKYTDASVAALNTALAAAKEALKADKQADVDAAKAALDNAVKALELKPEPVNYDALNAAIEEAEKIDKSKYTDESVAAFEKALADAKAAKTADNQAAVDKAKADLDAAKAALVEKPEPIDYSALNASIADAEKVDKTKYTDETVAAFEKALADAKAALTAENQAAVDKAKADLDAAKAALKEKPVVVPVNYDALNAAIADAEKVDKSKYTDDTVAAFETALAAAKAAQTAETQAAVDKAKADLDAAKAALKEKPVVVPVNYDALNAAIADADKVDKTKYTDDSVAAFEAALAAAKEALKADKQADVDKAKADLDAAKAALKEKPVEEPFRFDDVKDAGKFYFEPVYWAYEHEPQITKGTSEKLFSPDAGCTRGQVVTFLWRAMNEPEPESTKNPFEDVKEGAYYYKAVLWAVEKGITKGTSETTFRPDQTCTRGQIVTFLYRAQDPKPELKDKTNPFKDVAESAYYYDAVLWAVENEITKGKAEGFFRPELTCTRGEIVTFLYRAMAEEEAE